MERLAPRKVAGLFCLCPAHRHHSDINAVNRVESGGHLFMESPAGFAPGEGLAAFGNQRTKSLATGYAPVGLRLILLVGFGQLSPAEVGAFITQLSTAINLIGAAWTHLSAP